MTAPLPPIDAALVPAEVRKAGPEGMKLYQAALQFESMLTRQLAESLTSSIETDGAGDIQKSMLPEAFAGGITAAGGLGLAPQLYAALKEQA
jgi:Rod binding domain-containing protein